MNRADRLGLTCPAGAKLYICQGRTIQFIGCCSSDPCVSNGFCPQAHLRPASFNASNYEDISPQTCATGSSKWYVCAQSSVPFLGCCLSDACREGGCPAVDLKPATLSNNTHDAANFSFQASKTSTSLSIMPAPGTSTPTSETASIVGKTQPHTSSSRLNLWVGIGIGGLGFLSLCGMAIFVARRLATERRSHVANNLAVGPASGIEQHTENHSKRSSWWAPRTTHENDSIGIAVSTDLAQECSPLASSTSIPKIYRPYRPPMVPVYELE